MAQSRILVIDDPANPKLASQLRAVLGQTGPYEVLFGEEILAQSPEDAGPDLTILVLPDAARDAERALSRLEAQAEAASPILTVLTPQTASWLNRLPSCTEFLLAPLRRMEVLGRIERLLSLGRILERNAARRFVSEAAGLSQLVGETPCFAAVKARIRQAAPCDLPVLITGETGTGKELCARSLHYLSRRADKPFLPVNCGAIPVDLFESELFGREKGAFTGASATQRGLVAESEGGTLFLDEVETLSLAAQVKLLRFLEDHTYHVVGSPRLRRSDVRILAATNVQLAKKVKSGVFREDLFYRLAVLTLDLPPLRERTGDIPTLVALFLARHAPRHGAVAKRFSEDAMTALLRHSWPGNVRELENIVQELLVVTEGATIEVADLGRRIVPPPRAANEGSMKSAKTRVVEEFERRYMSELLQAHGGNVTRAALEAQKERRAFGRLIKKHNLHKN